MIEVGPDWVAAISSGRLRPIRVAAQPYPGVPTDVQAQFTALAATASGTSHIADRVFPERFAHVRQLARLGARMRLAEGCVVARGVPQLHGADVVASDLRASAALVLAGLAAEGTTIVHRLEHLDRGYEGLEPKLRNLGAAIERLPGTETREPFVRRKSSRPGVPARFAPAIAPVALATVG